MLIEDLISKDVGIGAREIQTIKQECSQFLSEVGSTPLLKFLPHEYNNFCRVKVRLQKRTDYVSAIFERAFGSQFSNLRQRAVFAYPTLPATAAGCDSFYVFPVNGYRYLFSKEVTDSNSAYKSIVEAVAVSMPPDQTNDIVSDLLKYTYTSVGLTEGIEAGAEIILYNIPCYYAVRASVKTPYTTFLT